MGKATEVAGTVFRDGKPAPGVTVTLQSSLTLARVTRGRTLVSDSAGRFSFGVLPAARYTVTAAAPDRIAARVDVDLGTRVATPPPDRLELYLGRCEAVVEGVVRDASGGVIEGASVGTTQVGQYLAPATQTGDHGQYRLCVARGINTISISASGYGAVERVVIVVGTRHVDVALSPAATIEGSVVDAAGSAVEQAAIQLRGRSDEVERVGNQIVTSDAQGHFHLEMAPGAGVLIAAGEQGTSPRLAIEVKPGELVRGLVLRLAARAPIRGSIHMNGRPAGGIELRLWSDSGSAETISEADGSFAVASGPVGSVRISSPTHRIVSGGEIAVPIGGVDRVEIGVSPLARITGRIERLGATAIAARISLQSPGHAWSAISDLQGVFRFEGLVAGTYELEASEDGGATRAPTTRIEITDGEDKDVGTLELSLTGRIAGHVLDDNGAVVAGASVTAESGGSETARAFTDDTGAFAIGGLESGRYTLKVRLRGALLDEIGGAGAIDLTVFRPELTDLTVRVHVVRLRIAGRVVDPAGSPLSDVSLQVVREGEQRSWAFVSASGVTGMDGQFSLEDLAGGKYAIRAAQRGGGEIVVHGAEAPRSDLAIVLAAQGAIEGRIEQFEGPVEVEVSSSVDHRSRRAQVDGDRFSLRGLAAGDYLVVAHSDSAIATTLVHVVPPEVARTVIRGRTPRRVTGVVRDVSSKQVTPGLVCAAAPRSLPATKLWYATAPTSAEGRFAITVGGDDVVVTCDGGSTFVDAAAVASGATIELWTIRRISHGVAMTGAALASDPLVARVENVAENSAAQRMGLRTGDVIVAIGAQSLDGIGAEVAAELWFQRRAQGPTDLTVLRGGKVVTLKTA